MKEHVGSVAAREARVEHQSEQWAKIADPRPGTQRSVALADLANGSARVGALQRFQDIADAGTALQTRPSPASQGGLPAALKDGIESLSGMDMSAVSVHRNSDKPAQLNALAYAQGNDIHLGPGQVMHLPHEAWHVVQQKQGRVTPTLQLKGGIPVNDDAALEAEADRMGQRATLHGEAPYAIETPRDSVPSSMPAVQRVIKDKDVETIQALSRQNVLRRMRHPEQREEPGEIATTWLKTNQHNGTSELMQWQALISEHLEDEARPRRIDEHREIAEAAMPVVKRQVLEEEKEEEPVDVVTSAALWTGQAAMLQKAHETLRPIALDKIARILMVYHHGVFNAIGKGGNPRYIRSDENAAIKLSAGGLEKEKNKRGEIPDIYYGIHPREWAAVIEFLSRDGGSTLNQMPIDAHISGQREISAEIMSMTKFPAPEKNALPLIDLIFDGNYQALNIHLPLLMLHTKEKQEIGTKKGSVGAGQGKGMMKFLMGRLMYLCNLGIKEARLKLVEKSSFGFQTPTLGDLGTNMTMRLSPGVDKQIVHAVVNGLLRLHAELAELMGETTRHAIGAVAEGSDLHRYWNTGLGGRGPSADTMRGSYNAEKTRLDHLLFTQVEKGAKGNTIIGRTFERNHDNVLHIANVDKTLLEWAAFMLALHSPEQLNASLNKGELKAPALLSSESLNSIKMHTAKDEVADQRLALFQTVAKGLKGKANGPDGASMGDDASASEWDEEGSDSEFEDEGVSGGKAVVPSGMASLSQMLGNEVKTEANQVKGKMMSGLYYEDFDHAKKNFRLAGYTTADLSIVDLNPNRAVSMSDEDVGKSKVEGVIAHLNTSGARVWIVDMTSSTTREQALILSAWKANKSAELLLTLVSGLKHQEQGLNTNPHGLIHWAYKGEKEEDLQQIKAHFRELREKPVNKRSKISNHMRRHFKQLGAYSWRRQGLKKDN